MQIPLLQDGEHTVVLAAPEQADKVGFRVRRAGLEIRDCFSVQIPEGSLVGFVLRKPFEDTILGSVLRRGTGTFDIDTCRISTTDSLGGGALNPESDAVANHEGYRRPWMVDPKARKRHSEGVRQAVEKAENLGRYPSNFLLVHGSDCKQVGTKQVGSGTRRKAEGGGDSKPFDDGRGWNQHSMTLEGQTAPHSYGAEEVPEWDCQSDCPVHLLDAQGADWMHSAGYERTYEYDRKQALESSYDMQGARDIVRYGDDGGASRFFYQAVSQDDLNEYLRTLTGTDAVT